jgi:apolipoprotein N-acyltransferase
MLKHRYALPLLSGVLLALVFFPFYLWPLAFVALAPLFYFVRQEGRGAREVFAGGVITGVVGIGPLIYLSLAQLTLFPDALAFTYLIRASSVPTALLVGTLFGLLVVVLHALRLRSVMAVSVIAAALYVLVVEVPMFWVFDGYYYGALSHAAAALPGVLQAASWGGAYLVSLLVAAGNSALAAAYTPPAPKRLILAVAFLCAGWGGLSVLHHLQPAGSSDRMLSVAVIQNNFEKGLEEAGGAELIIYPSSLQERVTTPQDDAANGARLESMAGSSTVLLWQTLAEDSALYDEYALWSRGEKSSYRKQVLYALSDDYTPAWLRALGVEKSAYAITPGALGNRASVAGGPVGSLICSELHQTALARAVAKDMPLVIAVGSDAMFPGPLSGNFALAAARLRAAENGVPVVRGNLEGPSAILGADGSVQAMLSYGETGVLRGVIALQEGSKTLYAKTGSWPVVAFALVMVALATARRFRN